MSRPALDPQVKADVAAQALDELSKRRVITLVTYPKGEDFPRLRGMGFVHGGWVVYCSTRREWLKAREIQGNPRATILFTDSTKRADHFVQIDCHPIEVSGEEFDRWQDQRYAKEGDALRNAAAGMRRDEWIGWRFEPVRARLMGYMPRGPWGEMPLVYNRADLGLPPLP